jgi:hypothetical protein
MQSSDDIVFEATGIGHIRGGPRADVMGSETGDQNNLQGSVTAELANYALMRIFGDSDGVFEQSPNPAKSRLPLGKLGPPCPL